MPATVAMNTYDGPINRLQPIRMADIKIKKIESFDSMASVPTPVSAAATTAPTPKYVAPYMRAAAASGAATPQSLDLNSASFPSLGGPGTSPKTVSWSQLRNRLTSVEPVAAPSPTPTTTALNFKDMIHARIEKDEAEAAERELPENEDPDEMTDEQLRAAGWAKLVLTPPTSFAGWTDRPDAEEKDPDLVYMNESWDWSQMGIPEEIMNSGDSYSLLNHLCRPGRAGENPWAAQVGYANDLANLLGSVASANKETGATKAFHALLERKKHALRTLVAATTAE